MGDAAGWEMQVANDERYWETCEAINKAAKAGTDLDALKTLCRETGVDIKHTILGDEIRPRAMGR